MAVPYSNTKLRVPKGFQNILEGLAREILRDQPQDPFVFGTKYFEQLLRVREETGHDPAIHGARLEDRFYNNDSFKNPTVDPSSPQQQDAATKIQTNYRKNVAVQEYYTRETDAAAEKIQAGLRGYQDRQKFAELKDGEKPADGEEEVDIDLNDPDVEKAAYKIQAGFKGFKARQEVKDIKEKSQKAKSPEPVQESQANEEEEVDIDLNDPEVNTAALKIQAGFRGHQTRQQLKDKQEAKNGEKQETVAEDEAKQTQEEEKVDIDLNDPETEKAALKIQAGFKGYQTRKDIKSKKDGDSETKEEEEKPAPEQTEQEPAEQTAEQTVDTDKPKEEVDIDINDPEVEKAAVKIQASFKGYKTRQDIKSKQESETDTKEGEGEASQEKAEETPAGDGEVKTEEKIEEKTGEPEAKVEQSDAEGNTEKVEEKTEGEVVDIDLNDPEVAHAATKIQAGFKGFKARQEIRQKKEGEADTTEKTDGEAEK